ncbi:MAG TPA: hypothetical protein VKA49_20075, partial [Flavitalea sp.]|nr:hypothetical protein [Flavitalea sp.]
MTLYPRNFQDLTFSAFTRDGLKPHLQNLIIYSAEPIRSYYKIASNLSPYKLEPGSSAKTPK